MIDSTELAQVIAEAEDIAQSVAQELTSSHLLLALFTVPNRGQVLLKERGVDEDRLLDLMTHAPRESANTSRDLLERARELAENCSSPEADCLHLLIAMTRLRCAAQDLLVKSRLDLSALRNHALSYYTGGHMPRRLQNLAPVSMVRPTPGGFNPFAPKPSPPKSYSSPPPSLPAVDLEEAVDEVEFAADLAEPDLNELAIEAGLAAPDSEAEADAVAASQAVDDIGEEISSAPISLSRPTHSTPKSSEPPREHARAHSSHASHSAQAQAHAHAHAPQHTKELDPKHFPWLAGLGRNLSLAAQRGQLDPVIGRDREVEEVIDILGKRRTNNPCLLGEPGVGKTAVVEGVAQALLRGKGALAEKVVVELDMASLVAGTQLRGSFSEKLNAIKDEVKKANGRVVVFIDELHTVIGAGSTGEGPQDAANELKSALARGEFPCIGATTHDEWRKFIGQDPALERRFTPVMVNEPTVAQTTEILRGVVERYGRHHGLSYRDDSLGTAALLASRYVSDRFLPDKAISIVDLAGSRCAREGKSHVESADVARVVAKLAGIPEERLLMKDADRLLKLEDELSSKVIGHRNVIERVAQVVRRNYAGFGSRRPMGSFLFLGPTGVGKTELAKALAESLFGSADAMVRVDMSELGEAHGVAKLVGAPPGYVGYGEGGQLTEPVRRRPASVVLLDEIEKAAREVLLLLLQVLDEGRLTDSRGRHIDFSSTVVVLTSNLGAGAFSAKGSGSVGFGSSASASTNASSASNRALEAARSSLPPELWNRIDERLVFSPLERVEVSRIASLLLEQSSSRLFSEKGIRYRASDEVIAHLIEHGGYDVSLGARPMRQTVQRLIEAPLAEQILSGQFDRGDSVSVDVSEQRLAFRVS